MSRSAENVASATPTRTSTPRSAPCASSADSLEFDEELELAWERFECGEFAVLTSEQLESWPASGRG